MTPVPLNPEHATRYHFFTSQNETFHGKQHSANHVETFPDIYPMHQLDDGPGCGTFYQKQTKLIYNF